MKSIRKNMEENLVWKKEEKIKKKILKKKSRLKYLEQAMFTEGFYLGIMPPTKKTTQALMRKFPLM